MIKIVIKKYIIKSKSCLNIAAKITSKTKKAIIPLVIISKKLSRRR